ncbi:transcription factor bHLH68-like isoform X2 [Mercurialis annua]|uniref:transcription factor bHLH68-like isoform X2 n=1 Tax=Mercurialis annua TaxID=3986 RepID=UPI002160B04E|nr:transcription factor bHLH68-like isoform X2 [Mercurialis annua]
MLSFLKEKQEFEACFLMANPNFLSSSPYVFGSSSSSSSPSSSSLGFNYFLDHNQELPQSWSQLLMGGLTGEEQEEEYRFGASHFHPKFLNPYDVKQEISQNSNLYGQGGGEEEFQTLIRPNWSQQVMPVSSPRSCVTSNNILDFSYNNKPDVISQHFDQSSECNSTAATGGGVCKKARVQAPSSSQPPLKVRKEKLGDRITALHQLVSPFGKTDTASVLLEAIGYIRFLQAQIEVQGERNCVFPEDPGQLVNDICQKRKGGPNQDSEDNKLPKDLKSRGLCLVPVSCTQHVGSDNGADYWAPAIGGGF